MLTTAMLVLVATRQIALLLADCEPHTPLWGHKQCQSSAGQKAPPQLLWIAGVWKQAWTSEGAPAPSQQLAQQRPLWQAKVCAGLNRAMGHCAMQHRDQSDVHLLHQCVAICFALQAWLKSSLAFL